MSPNNVQPDQSAQSSPSDWRAKLILPLTLASLAALIFLFWLLFRSNPSTPTLPSQQTSATREAALFATGEAIRQATRDAAAPTTTAIARATSTAQAHERETASSARTSTAAAQARSTAEAPVTQTAQAQAFATSRAQAEATTQALTTLSTLVYGPTNGTLEQTAPSQAACDFSHTTLSDFIAEATFHNPGPASQPWDYGIIFSNLEDESEYRLILDSDGSWTLNLHSSGFDISNRDTTPLLDLSPTASNTLKLFVTDNIGDLYINSHYVDTLDLTMFGLDPSTESEHDISVCAAIMEGNTLAGRPTLYDNFTIWSLP
jgi:hypothetical protein